jgi:hydroxymethylbilane synthase
VAGIVIGTRGSALALWQARHVAALLRAHHPGLDVEQRVIASAADEDPRSPIAEIGSTGVFVRRLEQALAAGQVDLAVHSLKDMPSDTPTGLVIAAVPERHDPRDALVSRAGYAALGDLPRGAAVGTGSVRRQSLLAHVRPDLRFVALRGNVDTRVDRLRGGECEALVLALAGLERLAIGGVGIAPLSIDVCVPAVGQGALALETRMDDRRTRALVEPLGHAASVAAVSAERAFLRRLGGGCHVPAAALAQPDGEGRLAVRAVVAALDGGVVLGECETGEPAAAALIGARLAERLLVGGGERLLASARAADPARGDAGR